MKITTAPVSYTVDSLNDIAALFEVRARDVRSIGKDQTPGNTADQLTEREARTYELCASIVRATTLTGFDIEEVKSNAREAAIDGFLFGRGRKTPVAHELVAGLDDGPSWAPEELYEAPICRMVYAVDRGDPSVGIPGRSSFVLAENQTGTLFPQLFEAWNYWKESLPTLTDVVEPTPPFDLDAACAAALARVNEFVDIKACLAKVSVSNDFATVRKRMREDAVSERYWRRMDMMLFERTLYRQFV